MFEIIKSNPWLTSAIIMVSQIAFIYFRTINMIHTSEKNWKKAIVSSCGVGVTWLLSMSLGVSSMINMQWQPILSFLLAGAIGTFIGIKTMK